MEEKFFRVLAAIVSVFILLGTSLGISTDGKRTDIHEVKNVIFMIGDGMGFNSLKKTEHDFGISLDGFKAFEYQGKSRTSSATNITTDSAAGGSALATGVRIVNDSVAVYPWDLDAERSYPMTLAELAKVQGKSSGIVTTTNSADATPADFSAHVSYRQKKEEITRQQMASDLDLIWGKQAEGFDREIAEANGFTVVTNKREMEALEEGGRSYAQFEGEIFRTVPDTDDMPNILEMTEKAIDLLDDNEKGFFLMIEAADIDKSSHKKNGENMVDAVRAFDMAIAYAIEYAEENGDTMVVCTADHETGGITEFRGEYVYTTGNHTPQAVPLFVYGCDNFIEQGESIMNKEVGRRTAVAMGEKNFPIEVKK